MASSVERMKACLNTKRQINALKVGARPTPLSLLSETVEEVAIGSFPEWGSAGYFYTESLHNIDDIISEYCSPLRGTNETAYIADELSGYINELEKSNSSLSHRVNELEKKIKAIEPYIPTIEKLIADYVAVEERVEAKKRRLIDKYQIKKSSTFKLWAGAEKDVDKAHKTLDDMLSDSAE